MQVKIVSAKFNEINEKIISVLDRGTTLIHSETGFKHNQYPVVLTVVNNRELTQLNNYVYDIEMCIRDRSSTIKILDSSDRGIRFINYNFLLYHEERAKEN